jgi:hypothetical protein
MNDYTTIPHGMALKIFGSPGFGMKEADLGY